MAMDFLEVVHVIGDDGAYCARCKKQILPGDSRRYAPGDHVVMLSERGGTTTTWTTSARPSCPRPRLARTS
jgi:hypothetical protein